MEKEMAKEEFRIDPDEACAGSGMTGIFGSIPGSGLKRILDALKEEDDGKRDSPSEEFRTISTVVSGQTLCYAVYLLMKELGKRNIADMTDVDDREMRDALDDLWKALNRYSDLIVKATKSCMRDFDPWKSGTESERKILGDFSTDEIMEELRRRMEVRA